MAMMRSLTNYSFSMHKQIIPLMLPPVHMITLFLMLVSVFSIVAFLCGSHSFTGRNGEETIRLGGDQKKHGISKLQSNISSKALLMAKMLSWKKVQPHNLIQERISSSSSSSEDDEEAVWKRKIIMGERCRPLEFSGNILYDSQGNPVLDSLTHPNHGK